MSSMSLLSDPSLVEELEDKLGSFVAVARSTPGLENIQGRRSIDELRDEVRAVAEGAAPADIGLEAIIRRFTRPVMLVQDDTCGPVPDHFENSEVIRSRVDTGMAAINAAIPSIGRVDLLNHRLDFAGTGWMVGPDILVTNRHVAREFAEKHDDGFRFLPLRGGGFTGSTIDWYREYDRGARATQVRVEEIVWIAEPDDFDVAFLRLAEPSGNELGLPRPLDLMDAEGIERLRAEMTRPDGTAADLPWVAVIGYPAQSPWNNPQDQQRIFDGIYGYKRLAPGQIIGLQRDGGLLHHDATTLGGNSGSAVVDLASGLVVGLHFQGIETKQNDAVTSTIVRERLREHAR